MKLCCRMLNISLIAVGNLGLTVSEYASTFFSEFGNALNSMRNYWSTVDEWFMFRSSNNGLEVSRNVTLAINIFCVHSCTYLLPVFCVLTVSWIYAGFSLAVLCAFVLSCVCVCAVMLYFEILGLKLKLQNYENPRIICCEHQHSRTGSNSFGGWI